MVHGTKVVIAPPPVNLPSNSVVPIMEAAKLTTIQTSDS